MKIENFLRPFLKKELPDIRPGDIVRVSQKVKDYSSPSASSRKAGPSEDKERIQTFEGQVLARKHGKGIEATVTLRKVISGIGVERIFPLHSPTIEKIEIIKREKVRRAKLYYLRKARGKKAKLKRKEFAEVKAEEKQVEETIEKEVKEKA